MIDGIIYIYTNKLNNKVYIGQTIDENRRRLEHLNAKDDFYFHKALRKYGIENFDYKILYSIRNESRDFVIYTLNEKEIEYIEFYNSTNPDKGYNLTKGGNYNSITTYISVQQLDLKSGEILNTFDSIHDACRYLNINVCGDISACCKGKRSQARGFRWQYSDIKLRSFFKPHTPIDQRKQILKIDLITGKVIDRFNSISEANKSLGLTDKSRSISKCCNHKISSAFGYKWEFENKNDISTALNKPSLPKKVDQINVETGKVLKTFESIYKAAEQVNISPESISKCINGRANTAAGYAWVISGNSYIKPQKPIRIGKSVVKIDKNTNEVLEKFPSISEASRAIGLSSNTQIKKCIKGIVDTVKGYKWKFENE